MLIKLGVNLNLFIKVVDPELSIIFEPNIEVELYNYYYLNS